MEITLELLLDQYKINGSVYDTIEYAINNGYGQHPTRPTKPIIKSKPTSDDYIKYGNDLKIWETEYETFKIIKQNYDTNVISVNDVIKDFIMDVSGIEVVPEKYRSKLWYLAWRNGHSNGFYEVYLKLIELIEIFED